MRVWLPIVLLLAGIAAAWAIPPSQQIIMFGQGSSASSPPVTPCTSTGIFNLGNVCNDIYFIGALK